MRVIAGTFRSRLLSAPPGDHTRPTSDRLRETLFNILQPRIASANFADLYSGTGAVGIEALSRGAAHVWFSENAPLPLRSLQANLRSLGLTSQHTLEDRGTAALLDHLANRAAQNRATPLDLVFLDPPYDAPNEYTATLAFLGSPRGLTLLAPQALIIAEHATRTPLAPRFGALHQTRTRKQGDASLTFFSANPGPSVA